MNTKTFLFRIVAILSLLFIQHSSFAGISDDKNWSDLPEIVGPIPVTEESRPFLGYPEVFAESGYIEEEFFLSGSANVYEWADTGDGVKIVAGPGHYVTRILVRRPTNPEQFSGNIELNILNASNGMDAGAPIDFHRMIQQGDVWIGITSKPINVKTLIRFNPKRYTSLNWANPAPVQQRCNQPSIIPTYMGGEKTRKLMAEAGIQLSWPETEDGLIWDMLGQLGSLLKSEKRDALLPGFERPWVYMTGISQSSIYIRTWLAGGFHKQFRTSDGSPVFDGYLAIVGPSLARINQCSSDIALDDPRQKLSPPDAPFMSISAEGEVWQSRYTRQPDHFNKDGGIVSYEVAGSSHKRFDLEDLAPKIYFASPQQLKQIGHQSPDQAAGINIPFPAGSVNNDFIWAPVVRGAWHNLQRWVRGGVLPPQAPLIEIDDQMDISRDKYGNARGGVRTPYIDAPLATHIGYLSTEGMGGITGMKTPFTLHTISSLYDNKADYLDRFSAAVDRAVAERWISANDAAAMKAAASTQWDKAITQKP